MAILVIVLLASVTMVAAFAEEPLGFRHPLTGEVTEEQISTLHYDLTYALALAAGFSISDSVTLQVWDQLVDSETLGATADISYTNCVGEITPAPDPDIVCEGIMHSRVIWPRWEDMQDPERCATSRFGPYSPFFHFPRHSEQGLGAMRSWARGTADVLVGYEAYAWGGPGDMTVMRASCLYTRTIVITTGMDAGSLEAFGTYLHSLADYYSHRECITAMDDLAMPWATHTLTSTPPCDYNPWNPQADDVHGREFGSHGDASRTEEAIQHVYRELVSRSLAREGRYYPLAMETAISGTSTLSETLQIYARNWSFDDAAERRHLLDSVTHGVLATRRPVRRIYVPLARGQAFGSAPPP